MDIEQYDELGEALNKMNRCQIHMMGMIAQLQAQILTVKSMLAAVQINAGCDPAGLQAQTTAVLEKNETELRDALKSWLAENGLIALPGDDPWWDRPVS